MVKVLVTGGTGFIAGHCIKELLQRSYTVVTTVRSSDKGEKVLQAFKQISENKLSYEIVKDVAQDGAFDEVIESTTDLDFVLHTASPFHYNVQDPVKDFLEPAVIGTTSILKAIKASAPSVKRVIITSSFAAMRDGSKEDPPLYDESCWNPITWDEAVQDTKKTYMGSKSLAEKAAWTFMEKEKPTFDLITIQPTLVFGPAAPHLSKGDISSLNTSNVRILDMIEGKMKSQLAPTGFYTWVDIRDVTLAHIKAMELELLPASDGGSGRDQRFFIIAGYHSNKEIAKIIAAMGPQFRDALPADLDAQEDDLPGVAERYRFNNKKSREVLGLEYTDLTTSVRDTVESLLKLKD